MHACMHVPIYIRIRTYIYIYVSKTTLLDRKRLFLIENDRPFLFRTILLRTEHSFVDQDTLFSNRKFLSKLIGTLRPFSIRTFLSRSEQSFLDQNTPLILDRSDHSFLVQNIPILLRTFLSRSDIPFSEHSFIKTSLLEHSKVSQTSLSQNIPEVGQNITITSHHTTIPTDPQHNRQRRRPPLPPVLVRVPPPADTS